MSFIDKILDKMSLNSEDDEEFDNEDYYLDDEEEEELPRNPFRRKKEAAEEEPAIKSTRRDTTPKEKPVKTTSKITPISKSSRKQVSSDMEVCVIKPSSIEDDNPQSHSQVHRQELAARRCAPPAEPRPRNQL